MNSVQGAAAALLFAAVVVSISLLPDIFIALAPEPMAPVGQAVQSSFHDVGHENAWVQFADAKERLVQVQTTESRIVMVVRLKKKEDLARFNVGWTTPVTFLCRDGGTNCDVGSQAKTYVGNVEVQPTVWKTVGGRTRLEILNAETP